MNYINHPKWKNSWKWQSDKTESKQQDTYMHNLQLQKDVDSAHQNPHLYTLP